MVVLCEYANTRQFLNHLPKSGGHSGAQQIAWVSYCLQLGVRVLRCQHIRTTKHTLCNMGLLSKLPCCCGSKGRSGLSRPPWLLPVGAMLTHDA